MAPEDKLKMLQVKFRQMVEVTGLDIAYAGEPGLTSLRIFMVQTPGIKGCLQANLAMHWREIESNDPGKLMDLFLTRWKSMMESLWILAGKNQDIEELSEPEKDGVGE